MQIDKADFEKQTVSLTPRYHLSAITYLIENNVFIDDTLKKAIAVCEKLKKSGRKTKIANMTIKEKKAKKDVHNKNQTTLLSVFSLAKMGKATLNELIN